MLSFALFMVAFGFCAAEGNGGTTQYPQDSAKIYNNTLSVLTRPEPISLLWYSNGLKNHMDECLLSRFLQQVEEGPRRTLETYSKFSELPAGNWTHSHTKINVTIHLHEARVENRVLLQVKPDKGDLDKHWGEQLFRSTRNGKLFPYGSPLHPEQEALLRGVGSGEKE
uniref:Putative secreted protein 94 n=1 Tax=Amblyomma americanum TaxID=6943 RepID=A0A0C9RXE1_AMBAM